jgi:glycosyltransferase involved in cell wall biosynthesis
MRIYHLAAHLRLGAGRYIVDLAVEQAKCGQKVSVCISNDAEGNWRSDPDLISELKSNDVHVLTLGDLFHRDAELLRQAARELKRDAVSWSKEDTVHAHTALGAVVGRWAGSKNVICTCHGWNPARLKEYDLQDAIAYSMCDGVLSPSTFWAERLSQLTELSRLIVLPNGFNLSRYPQLKPTHGIHRIVCVGELTARKGQDLLISVLPLIHQRVPDVELHFLGDGDAREQLINQSESIDPKRHSIFFHGFVSNPYQILNQFDLMCLPTRSDNQPVALIEAMLAGLPIVSTEVGGIPELISMVQCGACVPPDNVEALADAVSAWLNPVRRQAHALEKMQTIARDLFDIKNHAHHLELFYSNKNK